MVNWRRLAWAVVAACVLGFVGFAAFLQSIHNASTAQRVIEAIGLPLFELGAGFGFYWSGIIASVLLWILVLYTALGIRAGRKRDQPPAQLGR